MDGQSVRGSEVALRFDIAAANHRSTLIGVGSGGALMVRNLASGATAVHSPAGYVGRIIQISISQDGRLLASLGRDQTLRLRTLYDPVTDRQREYFGRVLHRPACADITD